MDEKRTENRQSLKYPAKIDVGGGERVSCLLSDVSASGAKMAVEFPEKVPDKFALLLAPEQSALRLCKVMWREGNQVGVKFVKVPPGFKLRSVPKDEAPPPPEAA